MRVSTLVALALLFVASDSRLCDAQEASNTLSAQDKRQGWLSLFDGTNTVQWRGFGRQEMPATGWTVDAGTLTYAPVCATCEKPGDIITKERFDNFELRLDWKVAAGANSGIKYLVDETLVKEGHSGLAFEMQILDNQSHPDAKLGVAKNRTAGGLYDLIAPSDDFTNPVGQWNEARLVVKGPHIEHWLNGHKVVEFERSCQMMKALIAYSKYKDKAGFGDTFSGHILLQEHGDRVWFRNIRIRKLSAPRRAGPK